MRVFEEIEASGHPNITAINRATFELTRDIYLTRRGDCIIAINASKGALNLDEEFKNLAKRDDAEITVIIGVGQHQEIVRGRGNSGLTFCHPTDLVIRRSSYICGRTLMICADKVAFDFSRDMVKELQKPLQKVTVLLIVEV